MTPPTVNAYYNPQMNDINFPAGILQPPFFDRDLDDAVNFGAIGAVIGHEMTHGFDDEGRQFDAEGNLRDWWTPEDAQGVREARRLRRATSTRGYTRGRRRAAQRQADAGREHRRQRRRAHRLHGARWTRWRGPEAAADVDGFTPEQRFFLGCGQVWCENADRRERDACARRPTRTRRGRYRVNGVVSNMPEFQKAFACTAGAPMVRENACRVW